MRLKIVIFLLLQRIVSIFLCAIFKELYLKDQSLSKLNREDSAFLEFKLLV